jgi:predicted permease
LREILSYGAEAPGLEQLAGYTETNANLTGGTEPERIRAAAVTANIFETLGVKPAFGRGFAPAENDPGAPLVVVLGHDVWQRRFGGADIVGRTIQVNGRPRTVIGIMPASFRLPLDYRAARPTEVWYPLTIDRANLEHWGSRSYFAVGRLTPHATAANATAEFKLIGDRWVAAGYVKPSPDRGLVRSAVPVQDLIVGDLRRPLLILLAAVSVVLLIACANVLNLLLARADRRRHEIVIRGALGASRGHLVGQLLTENMLLSIAGGLLGIPLARAAMQILITVRPAGLPRVEEAGLDVTVLAFAIGLAIMTGLVVGTLPALTLARQQLGGLLNAGGRGASPGKKRLAIRRGLVIAQLAFSVVLVIGAGLLVRSLIALNRIDLGFDPKNVLTAQLQVPASDYPDPEDVVAFYRQLTDRLQTAPGVVAAGAVRVLPIARHIGDWSITVEGRPLAFANENPNGDFQAITPGYLAAMRLTLLRGRSLTDADGPDAPLVVVINDTMADRYWPGQDAIGRRFQMGGSGTQLPPMTIVGVVRTSRHNAVVEAPRAEMYLPYAQLPRSLGGVVRAMAIVMRMQADPLSGAAVLRQTVGEMDRNLPVGDILLMEHVTATALAGPRFATFLLGLFALLALTLAAVGTYATISLLVSERSREIGIRMALGAGRRTIVRWVLREGFMLGAVGIGVGIAAAFVSTRLLESLLYDVKPLDPMTFATVPVLLGVVAIAASVTPAVRAASVDPVRTLRQS